MTSWRFRTSKTALSSAVSHTAAPSGARALARRWFGGLCGSLRKRQPSRRCLPMIFVAPAQDSATQPVESLSRSSSCSGIGRWRPRNGISAPGSGSCTPSMTRWASSQTLHRAEEVTANQTFPEILWVFSPLRPAHRVVRILTLPPKARELPLN
jgi:hypothetical protein